MRSRVFFYFRVMMEEHLFKNILYFQTLESTNDFLKANSKVLENHTIVLTGFQSRGRGQFDRVWESLPNMNLLFSILFKENIDPIVMNEMVVDALIEVLQHYDIKARYKKPNDIYVDELKIAGVLMETKFIENQREYLILGIGLNVNQQYFQVENATSMSLVSGIVYDKQEVFIQFLKIFENKCQIIRKEDE